MCFKIYLLIFYKTLPQLKESHLALEVIL